MAQHKRLCPECGWFLFTPRIWKGKEICYPCFRQHITDNSLPYPPFKKEIYEKRLI